MDRIGRVGMAACLVLLVGSAASADWKKQAMWCLSEISNTQGGSVVENLQNHQSAHARYCASCSGGSDQYDAVMSCLEGGSERAASARKDVEAAGRETVNAFLEAKAPTCCDPIE